jgi:threonine/homoserine/homoserine lactone efflux protein
VVWALVTVAWYVLFISLVQRWHHWVDSPTAQRAINPSTGAMLVALGVGVVLGI